MNYCMYINKSYLKFCKNAITHWNKISKINDILHVYATDLESIEELKNVFQQPNINLIYHNNKNVSQNFETYNTPLFKQLMVDKMICIKECLTNYGECLYFDADVVFFKNIEEDIDTSNDIVFAVDCPNHPYLWVCTGFFYLKNNKKVFNLIEKTIKKQIESNLVEQEAINDIMDISWRKITDKTIVSPGDIRNYNEDDIKLDVFPLNEVFCGWTITNLNNIYQDSLNKNLVKVVHANHTEGDSSKINMLKNMKAWIYE